MKRQIKMMALIAVLGLGAASCTKETESDNIVIVTTTQTATYVVDGRQYYANPQSEEEWSEFLDRMFALAEEGHSVQFWRNDVRVESSKETLTYNTSNLEDAQKWCKEKKDAGYTVSLTYNQETHEYNCIAVK